MSPHHIILVGMPCAGKSTIGKLLAERLGVDFADLDQKMADVSGKSVPQLLEDLGEQAFLEFEGQTLAKAIKSPTPMVISPGGSIVLDPKAREILATSQPPHPHKVIFLRTALSVIADRIQEVGRAPHIVGIATPLPLPDQLDTIYKKRKKFYEQLSDITIDLDNHSNPQDTVQTLIQKLELTP